MADDARTGPSRFKRWKNRVGRAFGPVSNRVSGLQQHPEIPETVSPASLTSPGSTNLDVPTQCIQQILPDSRARVPPQIIVSGTASELVGWNNTARSAYSAYSARTGASVFGLERRNVIRSLFNVWDNRLALKLFGSKRGIKKEEERLKNYPHWVIHPCSKFRIYWDMLMLVFLMLNVILLPVVISFSSVSVNPGWLTFSCFSDVIFLTDILLNFWTGYITEENTVILDLKLIRKFYVKRWLTLDVLSIFPFDYILLGIFQTQSLTALVAASKALRLLRLVKLLSLLRLFRVVRFMHYLTKWEEVFNATKSIARIVNFVLAVLLLAHWNGCIQFLVPFIQGFPSDSWVSINNLQNATVGTQYSWAIFKAFSHMLCIGFGRWPPQNTVEVWLTIVSMLIGASLYAMFIGHISTLIHSATSASRQYNEKLKQVEEYMRYRKLPTDLKYRVHEYYYQRYHGQLFDEEAILGELSHALTEKIVNFNCQELVRVVPFFADADEVFITSVITRLTFDVFLPEDYIIHCGAIGSKMYFIQHGVVDIINSDGKVATCLCDGSYFGEICLLMKCRRIASVKAVTACDLYCLSREDFELVLDEFPHMRRIMETVARERLAMIQRTLEPSQGQLNSTTSSSDDLQTSPPKVNQYTPALHAVTSSPSTEEYTDPADMV